MFFGHVNSKNVNSGDFWIFMMLLNTEQVKCNKKIRIRVSPSRCSQLRHISGTLCFHLSSHVDITCCRLRTRNRDHSLSAYALVPCSYHTRKCIMSRGENQSLSTTIIRPTQART